MGNAALEAVMKETIKVIEVRDVIAKVKDSLEIDGMYINNTIEEQDSDVRPVLEEMMNSISRIEHSLLFEESKYNDNLNSLENFEIVSQKAIQAQTEVDNNILKLSEILDTINLEIDEQIEEELDCAKLKLKVDKKTFSPNNDGIDDNVTFTITAPKDKSWTLELSLKKDDGTTELIKSFNGTGTGEPTTLSWDGITNDESALIGGKVVVNLKDSTNTTVTKNIKCEACDEEVDENNTINPDVRKNMEEFNTSMIGLLENLQKEIENSDTEDLEEISDGQMGTFSVKANETKTLDDIKVLLEKCYKLDSAIKDTSIKKTIAISSLKGIKEQGIKTGKKIIATESVAIFGGLVGEVISKAADAYFISESVLKVCDNVNLSKKLYDAYNESLNETKTLVEIVNDSISKKCQLNGDNDDLDNIRNNIVLKISERVNAFNTIINKALFGTFAGLESQVNIFNGKTQETNLNILEAKNDLSKECDYDYTNECKASDFVANNITKTKGPNRKTITCRVYYENVGQLRLFGVSELKGLLTETNRARNMVKNNTSISLDPAKPYRTFAVAKINNSSFIYDMNTKTQVVDENGKKLDKFAGDLPDKTERFFVDFNLIPAMSFNQTHAEITILEDIAQIYCSPKNIIGTDSFITNKGNTKKFNIYKCREANVDYFTDRATCGYCQSTIKNHVEKATQGITLNAKNFEFKTENQYGVFYSGEMIKTQTNLSYFNLLKMKP